MLTSVVNEAAVLVSADGVERLDLLDDLLVEGQDIAGLDVGGLVLLEQQQGVAGAEQAVEDGLLLRVERDGDGGGLHGDQSMDVRERHEQMSRDGRREERRERGNGERMEMAMERGDVGGARR